MLDPATLPSGVGTMDEKAEKQAWRQSLAKLGQEKGFYRELGDNHTALFAKSGDTLVVTFDNLDHVFSNDDDRLPWGFNFIQSRGWSILGMMAHGWTWYREDAVLDFFDELRDSGFFAQFKRVIFYGASMGGYAAGAFSAAAPGAQVIMISPQATLDPGTAGWETRYKKARKRDFLGRYGSAPESVASASKIYLIYDPLAPLDRQHADLFTDPRIIRLQCRLMGHRIASAMQGMGILKQVVEQSIEGTLTEPQFYSMIRARREYHRYMKELLVQLQEKKRHYLVALLCAHYLSTRQGPKFRRAMKDAAKALEAEGKPVPAFTRRKSEETA